MAEKYRETAYEGWLREEGLPVQRGYGLTGVEALELGPWRRLGGRGAYIQLEGMEGYTGMYVGEIPPGGAMEPERHLYDELIYILSGRGSAEVWTGERERAAREGHFFEWQQGSLFAPPLNTWHRLINGSGSEPVRFLGVTTAPVVMDLFHNIPFVFNSDWLFDDRYDGRPDYFNVGERRFDHDGWLWETNFIPDARGTSLDALEAKGAGHVGVRYEIAGNVLVGHVAEWPVGRYQKAHFHGGGAVLLIARSRGYTLMWPRELGLHPYQDGHAERVVRVDWQEGSVLSPPSDWFHQHFNSASAPARQIALRYGSHKYGVGFYDSHTREGQRHAGGGQQAAPRHASLVSTRKGGTMVEYADEDAEIRRLYRAELLKAGVPYTMPDAVFEPAAAGA